MAWDPNASSAVSHAPTYGGTHTIKIILFLETVSVMKNNFEFLQREIVRADTTTYTVLLLERPKAEAGSAVAGEVGGGHGRGGGGNYGGGGSVLVPCVSDGAGEPVSTLFRNITRAQMSVCRQSD